ncbi:MULTISPECIES: hypothetical protein [unclassified Bradyrhizobium]|uniref:hypothetical protein n=1 Tax=unclassified Bradyrhizobium TaxID=2631580 RepID=UPI002916CC88|nr:MULTISPECIES: hypothetical protein [unclassified Bradyrhizobium]
MSQILEALAVIKGKDATGNTFDQVASKIGRIARAANALNRDVQKQMNIASSAAANAEKQMARTQKAQGMIGSGAKMAIGAAAAYAGERAAHALAHKTVEVSAERSHEKTRMEASGMSEQEIEEAGKLAGDISKKFPSLSQTEMMHTARNVRSMVGTFEEATHVLEPLARLRVVALGAHPEKAEELTEDFDKLAKGMEIKGVTQDRAKFEHYIDNMAKAINVFGDTLRPTDYYEMFKYGRGATTALSDEFMLKTAPTLAQELGGSSAGKALASFDTQFVGGKMSNKALEQAEKYGLITDMSKVIKTSTGNVKGVLPGAFIGQEYLKPGQEDPYAWVNKALLPQLAKKGVTDPAQIQEIIGALSSQQTTAQMLKIFATQQKRIEKDWELVHGAKGGEAAETFQKSDPKVIAKSIGSQLENTLANTTEPAMPAVNQGMNWLASGLSWTAQHAKERPGDIATGGGWLAGMVGALSVDSAMSFGSHIMGKGGSSWMTSKLAASLAPVLALTQLADSILDDHDIERLKRYEAGPRARLDRLKELDESEKAASIYGDDDPEFRRQLLARNAPERKRLEGELERFGYNPAVTQGRWDTKGAPGWTVDDIRYAVRDGSSEAMRNAAERVQARDRELDGYNPAVTQGRWDRGAPGWTIDDIRKATGIGSNEPVKAEIEGNATLETKVTVEPSPDFLTRIETRIQNAINAFRSSGAAAKGSTGSTGQSMPEAAPSP